MQTTSRLRSHPGALTVVYDGDCMLCRRSVRWLRDQRTFVDLEIVPAASPDAISRFGHMPDYGDHMIVATDDGRIWVGPPDAYLSVMWALPKLRALSYLLSIRPLKPYVGRVFQFVTGNRHVIGSVLGDNCVECRAP